MKKLFHLLLLIPSLVFAQTIGEIEFGTPETFDVVTWNIEFFPKNGQTTIQYVANIVEAIDADVIAIQEVSDYFAWNDLVSYLDDYSGYRTSINNRGLAYLYKTDLVQINNGFELFTQEPENDNFPRFPMVLDVMFAGKRYVLINNHFKCCGNGDLEITDPWDEETRRFNASNLLKDYIDTNLNDVSVIVLGDLNDILTDEANDNVFYNFLNDGVNYQFADYNIATGSSVNWSYPTWPSHLDHILITDELFDEFAVDSNNIETLKIENYLAGGFDEYNDNVSDHRPVGMKLLVDGTLGNTVFSELSSIINIPNPLTTVTTFILNKPAVNSIVLIYSIQGQQIFSRAFSEGKKELEVDLSELSSGIYIAHLEISSSVTQTIKIIKR